MVHKLQIDTGFTCSNRDGRGSKLRQGGVLPSIAQQIAAGKACYQPSASRFISYSQALTNPYAPVAKLNRCLGRFRT